MKTLKIFCILAILCCLLIAPALAAESASPQLELSFSYEPETDPVGLIGFLAQYNGLDRCSLLNPDTRKIRCVTLIKNEPITITILPLFTWGRRGEVIARVVWSPLAEMFEDPPTAPESELVVVPINELDEI